MSAAEHAVEAPDGPAGGGTPVGAPAPDHDQVPGPRLHRWPCPLTTGLSGLALGISSHAPVLVCGNACVQPHGVGIQCGRVQPGP